MVDPSLMDHVTTVLNSPLDTPTSLLLSDADLVTPELGKFGGSYASLYATLLLYVISFPGLYSMVKRSTKIDITQKTYTLPGPLSSDPDAKPLRQVAAEVMAYFQSRNYKVVDAGEVIVFKGEVGKSVSQAWFLSFCTFIGAATLALVLEIQIPSIGPLQIGGAWYLMCLAAPAAGLYYWNNAQSDDEVRVRLQTSDDDNETEVTLQASKENVDEFFRVMDYSEKGMVRVKGILE